MRSIKYPLHHASDCLDEQGRKLVSFTIRSTDGTDESYAARRADAKGTNMTEELIRYSIVAYEVLPKDSKDGDAPIEIKIVHPFESFEKWSTKARNFVVAAWKRLATPDEADLSDFFANATEVA